MDWQSFVGPPELRTVVVSALVTLLIQIFKPMLPTSKDPNDPTVATENRWLPAIAIALTILLNVAGAAIARQDIAQSAFLGLVASLTVAGGMRSMKLTSVGDATERDRALAVRRAASLEKATERLETKLEVQEAVSDRAIALVTIEAVELATKGEIPPEIVEEAKAVKRKVAKPKVAPDK